MPHKCVVEGCGVKLRNWLNLNTCGYSGYLLSTWIIDAHMLSSVFMRTLLNLQAQQEKKDLS